MNKDVHPLASADANDLKRKGYFRLLSPVLIPLLMWLKSNSTASLNILEIFTGKYLAHQIYIWCM